MQPLRENIHLVSNPLHLDSCVEEVFGTMLGVTCHRADSAIPQQDSSDSDAVTAVVGFGGVLSGACVFRAGGRAALVIAGRMAGMKLEELDDTVKDAVGEIGNMLAGAWKGRIPELSAHCGLSIPAVITGSNYRIHVPAPEFRLDHVYQFESTVFAVTIICDGLQ